jgi:hypothetical protein
MAQQSCALARKELNKYDLAAAPCLCSANLNNDWFRWFAISSSTPICSLIFRFLREVAKK